MKINQNNEINTKRFHLLLLYNKMRNKENRLQAYCYINVPNRKNYFDSTLQAQLNSFNDSLSTLTEQLNILKEYNSALKPKFINLTQSSWILLNNSCYFSNIIKQFHKFFNLNTQYIFSCNNKQSSTSNSFQQFLILHSQHLITFIITSKYRSIYGNSNLNESMKQILLENQVILQYPSRPELMKEQFMTKNQKSIDTQSTLIKQIILQRPNYLNSTESIYLHNLFLFVKIQDLAVLLQTVRTSKSSTLHQFRYINIFFLGTKNILKGYTISIDKPIIMPEPFELRIYSYRYRLDQPIEWRNSNILF